MAIKCFKLQNPAKGFMNVLIVEHFTEISKDFLYSKECYEILMNCHFCWKTKRLTKCENRQHFVGELSVCLLGLNWYRLPLPPGLDRPVKKQSVKIHTTFQIRVSSQSSFSTSWLLKVILHLKTMKILRRRLPLALTKRFQVSHFLVRDDCVLWRPITHNFES